MNETGERNGIKHPLQFLSSAAIKHIAIILMIVNHVSAAYFDNFAPDSTSFWSEAHWYFTRASFVLFTFLIAEGLVHTRNRMRYVLNLTFFAFLSEVPYDLFRYGKFFSFSLQNVFFTLALGALTVAVIDMLPKKLRFLSGTGVVILACAISFLFKFEYSVLGVILIVLMYYFREKYILRLILCGLALYLIPLAKGVASHLYYKDLWYVVKFYMKNSLLQFSGIAAFIPIAFYSGEKGRQLPKYFYYAFYPVHMLLIVLGIYLIKLVM